MPSGAVRFHLTNCPACVADKGEQVVNEGTIVPVAAPICWRAAGSHTWNRPGAASQPRAFPPVNVWARPSRAFKIIRGKLAPAQISGNGGQFCAMSEVASPQNGDITRHFCGRLKIPSLRSSGAARSRTGRSTLASNRANSTASAERSSSPGRTTSRLGPVSGLSDASPGHSVRCAAVFGLLPCRPCAFQ